MSGPSSTMRASGRGWRLAAGGLLAVLLLYFFLRGVAWKEIGQAMRAADRVDLALVVASTVLVYLARAWRWGYLLDPLARVPLSRLFSATVVGFMTGLVVPRAGEVVRPYLVARRYPIATSAGFATIILERLVDLITVLGLFFLYLYVLPLPPEQTRGPLIGVLKTFGALAALAALAVLGVLFAFHVHADRAMAVFDRVLARLPHRIAAVFSGLLRAFGEGLAVLQAPARHLLIIMAQSVLVWLAIALSIHLNNRAFGIQVPFHACFLILGFLTVGVAVPTPGMVGGFHEAFLLALTQSFGVDKGTAAAAGITMHALSNLPVLIGGLLLLPGEGLTLGRVAEMTAESESKEDR
jgi:glycosyltransferase 2 family protein